MKKLIFSISIAVFTISVIVAGLFVVRSASASIDGISIVPDTYVKIEVIDKSVAYYFSEEVGLKNIKDGEILKLSDELSEKFAIYVTNKVGEYKPEDLAHVKIEGIKFDSEKNSISVFYNGSLVNKEDSFYILDAYGYDFVTLSGGRIVPKDQQVFMITGDRTPPTATVSYSTTAPTNTDVIATIVPSEEIIGDLSHTFTENGSFTFSFTDLVGNKGEVEAIVNNIDKIAPVISIGDSTININVGSTFIDPGYSATDNIDGDITANVLVINPVNTNIPGNYTITYNVSDSAGNKATEMTRIVVVVAPVVSGGGGSGGGVAFLGTCTDVTYGEWGPCINNSIQYRDVISQTPSSCSLSVSQQLAKSRSCGLTAVSPVSPLQQVLGAQKYSIGTLLRSKSTAKIYVVTGDNTLRHIPSLKELSKYRGKTILSVDESIINSFSQQVLGAQKYGNGTLLRSKIDNKIYVIVKGDKVHIKNTQELKKYRGKPILNVSSDVLEAINSQK